LAGAYQTSVNVPVTVLHPVRDVNGALVPSQAAAVVKALLKPDRTAASEVATLSDIGTTGWVQAVLSPTAPGQYTLQLTSPGFPTADGRFEEYAIVVSSGLASSTGLLTTLDRVRTRLQLKKIDGSLYAPTDVSPIDGLINAMISEVSDEYQNRLGRTILEAGYIDYLHGNGLSRLPLNEGPLVSIASLETVAYSDNGAGGVTETRTLVAPHLYVGGGLRGQGRHLGVGAVVLLGRDQYGGNGSVFTRGDRNYRVSYTGGFSTVPEGIVGIATTRVVNDWYTKDTKYLLSKTLSDSAMSVLSPERIREEEERALAPYLVDRL
jgi:hypothetical protein